MRNTTKVTRSFTFEQATKNMYRFREDGPNPIVGTLYMNKSVFVDDKPVSLTATFEW